MDKLDAKLISAPFRDEVTRLEVLVPEIAAVLKPPLDLASIRKNVTSDKYESVQDWGDDMRALWKWGQMALEKNPLGAMAADLSTCFEKQFADFPRCQNELWLRDFNTTRRKLRTLIKDYPLPHTDVDEPEMKRGVGEGNSEEDAAGKEQKRKRKQETSSMDMVFVPEESTRLFTSGDGARRGRPVKEEISYIFDLK